MSQTSIIVYSLAIADFKIEVYGDGKVVRSRKEENKYIADTIINNRGVITKGNYDSENRLTDGILVDQNSINKAYWDPNGYFNTEKEIIVISNDNIITKGFRKYEVDGNINNSAIKSVLTSGLKIQKDGIWTGNFSTKGNVIDGIFINNNKDIVKGFWNLDGSIDEKKERVEIYADNNIKKGFFKYETINNIKILAFDAGIHIKNANVYWGFFNSISERQTSGIQIEDGYIKKGFWNPDGSLKTDNELIFITKENQMCKGFFAKSRRQYLMTKGIIIAYNKIQYGHFDDTKLIQGSSIDYCIDKPLEMKDENNDMKDENNDSNVADVTSNNVISLNLENNKKRKL